MILFKDTKAMVCSPDGNSGFFDFVVGVLQGYSLAPFLFKICLQYVLRIPIDLTKENSLALKMVRNWRYPEETITDANCADTQALFTNTPTPAKRLLDSLKQAARGTGFDINSDQTEFICFK